MRKIAAIYSGHASHYRTFHEPKYNQYIDRLIYLREFQQVSLDEYDVLIVPSQLHGGLLLEAKDNIYAFAERGGIIVAFGPQPWEWLPNQHWEERETNFWWWLDPRAHSGLVLNKPDHPLFKYITLSDCTWHQHGVFWPPQGAEILISTEDGGAVLYIDKVSTKGTWLITTLDPDYHYGSYFMPATERFFDGLFPWLSKGEI